MPIVTGLESLEPSLASKGWVGRELKESWDSWGTSLVIALSPRIHPCLRKCMEEVGTREP